MNFRYPIFLDISGKRCLVTGEGFEIAAKTRKLIELGAQVTYVNPIAEPSIAILAAKGYIEWRQRDFEPADLDGCFLVITDHVDNARIFQLAEERNVLCNSVDDPEHCRFSFGSIVSRGDLTLAISTNGAAPALAVRLREQLQRDLGPEYEQFVSMLSDLRPEIARELPDFEARKELWYRMVDSGALDEIRQGRAEQARGLLRNLLSEAKQASRPEAVPDTVKEGHENDLLDEH
jgi:siroheme synthase-like protein